MHLCSWFFSSRRRHTRFDCDWSSDVCSSDLPLHGQHDSARWGGRDGGGAECSGLSWGVRGRDGFALTDSPAQRETGAVSGAAMTLIKTHWFFFVMWFLLITSSLGLLFAWR